jgi:hypothetical protein
MNLTEVCRNLRGLASEDRAWILARLSSAAKMKLARGLGADGPLYEQTVTAKAMRLLDARDVGQVLAALQGEPSWVVYAIWCAASWSWRSKLLRGLPAHVRLDLQALTRDGAAASPAVSQFLVRALAERMSTAPKPARAAPLARFLRIAARRSA